ncbi:MAG: hypothetical protein ABSG57_07835 [Candidatus Bathyarchaeia archaeon]
MVYHTSTHVKPLAVRDTFLKGSKLRGRYFHGLRLDEDELRAIVTQAEAQR